MIKRAPFILFSIAGTPSVAFVGDTTRRRGTNKCGLILALLMLTGAHLGASDMRGEGTTTKPLTRHGGLAKAIRTASHQGRPLSGRYIEPVQEARISVYTEHKGTFDEVQVDDGGRVVVAVREVTEPELLAALKAQHAAMKRSRLLLTEAIESAMSGNGRMEAVSIVPSMQGVSPTATVILARGTEKKEIVVDLEDRIEHEDW